MPPTNKPITTNGFDRSKLTSIPSNAEPDTVEKNLISSVYAANKTKAPNPADPIAYPYVTALVVFPTASNASVVFLTFFGSLDISAIPPALSVTGP